MLPCCTIMTFIFFGIKLLTIIWRFFTVLFAHFVHKRSTLKHKRFNIASEKPIVQLDNRVKDPWRVSNWCVNQNHSERQSMSDFGQLCKGATGSHFFYFCFLADFPRWRRMKTGDTSGGKCNALVYRSITKNHCAIQRNWIAKRDRKENIVNVRRFSDDVEINRNSQQRQQHGKVGECQQKSPIKKQMP
jgi:hypothetical protein